MRHSHSTPSGKRRRKESSDDDFADSDGLDQPNPVRTEELTVGRHSIRNAPRAVDYSTFDSDDGQTDDESEDAEEPGIFGNGKIDKIFMVRQASSGIEYLVSFQESSEPFSQWISRELLLEFPNANRSIQRFSEMEMEWSFYDTETHTFMISYKSPVHVIAHRPMNNDPASNSLEFLCQFTLEIGTAFVWEPPTADSPQNLIEHYMATRVCVINTRPDRPASCLVADPSTFASRDGSIPRDYQVEGVDWLLRCFCAKHGCILADEMGLGKTIQALVFLMHLNRATDWHGPHIIAVRTNTFAQWCSELERWSDLKYIAYTGGPETRDIMRDYQMPYFDDKGIARPNAYGFNVLLVTYDIFLKDFDLFKTVPWQILIIDEGHRIKNNEGKKHNAFVLLPVMHRIILTGTPIQSTLQELWTLLNFVSPEYFVDDSMFPEDDAESLDEDILNGLRRLIGPHLMRRSLLDVERSIVPKDERIAFLQLTRAQKQLTRLTRMHELWRVAPDDSKQESNMLMRICNHPFLIGGVEGFYASQAKMTKLQLMINSSAKFIFLDRVLPIFKRTGRSVLIFSQRLKVLKMLVEYCRLKKYTHELLIGSLTETEKKASISRFLDEERDVFIFLLSTRSGSEGLNLTKASITIIFDPDWNPQNDLQALGRNHRIGQTQKVDVIRLITYGTYEHDMFSRAQRKLRLWTTLLGDGQVSDPAAATPVRNPRTETQAAFVCNSLLGPSTRTVLEELGAMYAVATADHEIVRREEREIPEPPDISVCDEVDDGQMFEDVLHQSATVVKELPGTKFPELDLSLGMTDEEFLDQFPVDPALAASAVKHRNRVLQQRVQIDPKTAKRMIKCLEAQGYGAWETIHAALAEFCPIEQLVKFSQTAIFLHFRAMEPPRIALFPLLLRQLQNDIPNFDLAALCCSDRSEWYSIFSKRGAVLSEGTACKQISNFIHKTALAFLTDLEHHLLLAEYRKTGNADTFAYCRLPWKVDCSHTQDRELVQSLLAGRPIRTDMTRLGQVIHVIKQQLILRPMPIPSYVLPFWTEPEVQAILDALKNWGVAFQKAQERDAHARTGLLSKSSRDIQVLSHWLVQALSQRRADTQSALVIPDYISMSQKAPALLREPITISANEAMIVLKRIFLNDVTQRARETIRSKNPDLAKVVFGGHDWWTVSHCVTFFDKLLQFGMDSWAAILLSPELCFREHLTDNDMQYLRTFNKLDMKPESQLPVFLHNENRFYGWMKVIAGHAPRPPQQQQQQVQPRPPIPLAPRPPPAAIVHRAVVSRVIPPRAVPAASAPPPPPPPPPPQTEKPSLPSRILPFGGDMPPPLKVKPEILAQPPPRLPSPATVRKHAVIRKVVTTPSALARSVAFSLSEPPQVLFHCGDPAVTRKQINRKTRT
jgi:superfamily II DNA or RNA helicase